MRITRTNTILYCAEWADTVAFYRDTIGLESSFENDWFVEFGLTDGSHVSVADARRATIEPGAGGGSGLTLSWQVTDLSAQCARLATLGVDVPSPIRRWGASTVFIHDPEGNRIELWEPEAVSNSVERIIPPRIRAP
ncbi:MAG: VOC family protein [Ilumatobacter sp.]|uniref:VOC family protein n=1 Tax=Ilumatobacter sp. TaxID=1967498 RepID=UPI003C7292F8